jgi:long-chain acyl-CoA synthetase
VPIDEGSLFAMTTDSIPAPWLKIHRELGLEFTGFDDRDLGRCVADHARRDGDAPALRFMHRNFSYGELDELANRFATVLVDLGVGKNDVVGLHLPNLPQYAIALVAIARVGCIGSGVSPLLAPVELAYQVRDAGISVLLSTPELIAPALAALERAPDCLRTVITTSPGDCLGAPQSPAPVLPGVACHAFMELMAAAGSSFEPAVTHWNDTFMIQYTGGTTGRPKGAMLSVRTLLSNPRMTAACAPWREGEDVLASAFPMFHVAGLGTVIGGLIYGAHVMLIPDPRDIEHFCQQMIACPPTRMTGVPTLYQMLVNHPASARIDFSRLRNAATGAAPLTGEDRVRIEALIGKGKLCDVFGMTETGPVHTMNPPGRLKPDAVGIPLPGMEVRIVDLETGTRELSFGEPGEIITSGPQVMKGYLNLPEESARALRQWRGKTWMYTGDVGFMDDEGYIHLCDRAKDMLIVGGYKVFSVEVEDKLAELDCIAQSAIVGAPDAQRSGSDIVHLFATLTPQAAERDRAELRAEITAFCRATMSAYKVPKVIEFVAALPLTPVGKIDKKLLREQARKTCPR